METTCSPPSWIWERRATWCGFSAESTSTPSPLSSSTWCSAYSLPSSPTPTKPSKSVFDTNVDILQRCFLFKSNVLFHMNVSVFFFSTTRKRANQCPCFMPSYQSARTSLSLDNTNITRSLRAAASLPGAALKELQGCTINCDSKVVAYSRNIL